jgi:hypothetical protein
MPNYHTSYQIQKEPDGHGARDQIIDLVLSRKQASEKYDYTVRRKFPQFYDQWRGYFGGRFTPTKNNVHIPMIFSAIQADVARKMATSFSQFPAMQFVGVGQEDAVHARKQTALVNAQLQDADVVNKEYNTFLAADLYGTAISQIMWEHKSSVQKAANFERLPLSNEIVRTLQEQRVVEFDGPMHKNIDALDFFPQPGYRNINGVHGMQWCLVRYYLDLDQCRFLASEQGGNVFDPDEVEQMAANSSPSHSATDELMRRAETRMGSLGSRRNSIEKYTRPVEIIEMWGEIPRELAGAFGGTKVVITLGNETAILRAKEMPYHHKHLPFVKFSPTPDPHYFWAPGKGEVAFQLQIAGARFLNHQLDAADLLVHPMLFYDKDKMINTRNMFVGPGRIFGVDGNPANAVMPMQMDYRTLQAGGQMTSNMWDFLQMGTAIQEDTVMGLGGGDRQTAREFMGRREASGTRLMLESVLYENDYFQPLCNHYGSLNRQFLELPRQVLIMGEAAQKDVLTGADIPPSREEISGLNLMPSYAARALGSTMNISREATKANHLTMFQVLASAGPAIASKFNMVNFLRQMLSDMGYRNVDELIQPVAAGAADQFGVNNVSQIPSDAQGMMELVGGGAPSGPQG